MLVVAGALLAVATSWPLALHLTTHIPEIGFGDPLLQAWQVAWGGHALAHQPTRYFQANTFWPLRDSLAFSDALIGYAPAGSIGSGVQAALIRYNLLYLFAHALAFAGAYGLARVLGVGIAGAAVAGAAFAYAPWRLAQNTHLHVISSGGIPLALLLLVYGYRQARPPAVLAGWLAATWQLSLGFTLGLQLAYLLAVLAGATAAGWLVARRPLPSRAVLAATLLGMAVFLGWGALQAQPYLRVAGEHPDARRSIRDIAFYSPPPRGLLAAPENSLLWGEPTRPVRDSLNWPTEQALFPGVVVVALAVAGVAARGSPGRLRLALLVAAGGSALLSLGLAGPAGEHLYGTLYQAAPGWQGIRTPGRLTTLTSLALALLAAIGAQRLLGRLRQERGGRGRPPAMASLAGLVMAGVVLAEGYGPVRLTRVPPAPALGAEAPGPRLHLPSDTFHDPLYMFWSAEDFVPVVNGLSGFLPRSLADIRSDSRRFPDGRSATALRELGVRTVVVHHGLEVRMPPGDRRNRTGRGISISWDEDRPPSVHAAGP